jgi:hypothetical protein
MSQSSTIYAPQAAPRVRQPDTRTFVVLTAAIAMFILALVAVRMTAPAPTSGLRTGEAVDGYLAGAISAHTMAVADQAVDGFLPGLVAAHAAANDPVDGYLPGLLAARGSGGEAVDGWEAGLSLLPGSRPIIQDGWEASLLQ